MSVPRRRNQQVDYRTLDRGEEGSQQGAEDGADCTALHAQMLAHSSYRQGAVRRLPAGQLSAAWLQQHGTFRPVLVPAADGAAQALGLRLPPVGLTPAALEHWLGSESEVETVDVASQQQGPIWTQHQWGLYWEARLQGSTHPAPPPLAAVEDEADSFEVQRPPAGGNAPASRGISSDAHLQLLMAPAMDTAGTKLAAEVSAPAAVTSLQLGDSSPAVGMLPEGGYLDFALAPAGAAAWVHVVSGRVSLALIPPTPSNLATYAAWAQGARRAGVFLAVRCEGAARVDLGPGDTALLPPGWATATAATAPAVTLGGTYLRADSLALHLDAWRVEEQVGSARRQRQPQFKELMWRTAERYARSVSASAAALDPHLEEKVHRRAAAMAEEDAAIAAAAPPPKARTHEGGGARRGASRAKAAAPASAKATPTKQPAAGGRKRRKGSVDSFIESSDNDDDNDAEEAWAGGGVEDDWAPGSSDGDAAIEAPMSGDDDDEDYSSGDDGASGGGAGQRARRQRPRLTARQAAAAGASDKRTTTRYAGRLPSRLRAALHDDDDNDISADGDASLEKAAPSWDAAPAPQPMPIKLKVRLPGAAPAPPAPPAAPRVVLKLKPVAAPSAAALAQEPTIPQVDGPADGMPSPAAHAAPAAAAELSEGEEVGLAALLCTLRRWLQDPYAAHDAPAELGDAHLVLARLELSMQALGLPLDPPPGADLDSVDPRSLLPAGREMRAAPAEPAPASSSEGAAPAAAASDSSPGDASGDNGVVVEESAGPKRKPAGAGAAAAARPPRSPLVGAKGRGGKKLSVKDRLKKKLGI